MFFYKIKVHYFPLLLPYCFCYSYCNSEILFIFLFFSVIKQKPQIKTLFDLHKIYLNLLFISLLVFLLFEIKIKTETNWKKREKEQIKEKILISNVTGVCLCMHVYGCECSCNRCWFGAND